MDRRRTLNHPSASSSIPVPPSVPRARPSEIPARSNKRQSIAPARAAPPPSVSRSHPRPSYAPSYSATPFPPPSSVRRSSLGRRTSSLPSQLKDDLLPYVNSAAPLKDSRSIDKSTLAQFQAHITNFLKERGYSDPLTSKTLSQPTGKDFYSIFRFIYSQWDPAYNAWHNKKTEEVVPELLKRARYPFASSIPKSHFQTIGTKHSWPNMLAMLHWFVTRIVAGENALSLYPEVQLDIKAPSEPDSHQRPQATIEYWHEYLNATYPLFLVADDYDDSRQLARFKNRFDTYLESIQSKITTYTDDYERTARELSQLESKPNELKSLQKEHHDLQHDVKSMETYGERVETTTKKCEIGIEEYQKRLVDSEKHEQQLEQEFETLTKRVNELGLTERDVQQMKSSRQTLDDQLYHNRSRLNDQIRLASTLEIELQSSLASSEELIDSFSTKAFTHGLHSTITTNTDHNNSSGISYSFQINGAATTPEGIVPKTIPILTVDLAERKQAKTRNRHEQMDTKFNIEQQISRIEEVISILQNTSSEQASRLSSLRNTLNTSKDAFNLESNESSADLERLQTTVSLLKQETQSGVFAEEQKLAALENESHELQASVARKIQQNSTAFYRQLDFIINMKERIDNKREDMKKLVLEDFTNFDS